MIEQNYICKYLVQLGEKKTKTKARKKKKIFIWLKKDQLKAKS